MSKADKLPPSCAVVTKSGNLNFLEPSGPALPFSILHTSFPLSPHPVLGSFITEGHGVTTFLPSYSLLFYLLIYSLIFYFTFVPSSFSPFAHASVFLYLHLLQLVITSLSRNILLQSSTDDYNSPHPPATTLSTGIILLKTYHHTHTIPCINPSLRLLPFLFYS